MLTNNFIFSYHNLWKSSPSSTLSYGQTFTPGWNRWWHFTKVNSTTGGEIAISQLSTHGASFWWWDAFPRNNQLGLWRRPWNFHPHTLIMFEYVLFISVSWSAHTATASQSIRSRIHAVMLCVNVAWTTDLRGRWRVASVVAVQRRFQTVQSVSLSQRKGIQIII